MFVIKRDGTKVHASFDEISKRLRVLCRERGITTVETENDAGEINVELVAQKTISQFPSEKDRILKTTEIDHLSAEICEHMTLEFGPAYHKLAGALLVSALHKDTPARFSEAMQQLVGVGAGNGNTGTYLDPEFMRFVAEHTEQLDQMIDDSRDYQYDYFSIQTLMNNYLLTDMTKKILDRPQYMHLRVAIMVSKSAGTSTADTAARVGETLAEIRENYRLFSELAYTHATPTLLNSGRTQHQLSSCFLLETQDNLEAIYDSLKECAQISKLAGGIGLSVSRVRAKGAMITPQRKSATGLLPMLRLFNDTAFYVNQSGARKGAIAIYLEPWHRDIFDVLELKTNSGDESTKCRHLFFGLWVCDLFMKRVDANAPWTLFSPDDTPDLPDLYGAAFEARYVHYEATVPAKHKTQIPARTLWYAILKTQIETGMPYVLFKDAANEKSNQKNIGVIQSSNLCTEIMEVAKFDTEIANCNLASISLPHFVKISDSSSGGDSVKNPTKFDFQKLAAVTRQVVRNLNTVIDKTLYPNAKCRASNMKHRPLGIGVQGLADVFMRLGLAYDEPRAQLLNREIFAVIYYAALQESCALAAELGPYESFAGSPASQGILQFDMWGVSNPEVNIAGGKSLHLDWVTLKKDIMRSGLRNSLLLAPMPTATTSSIMGNTESFEPLNANIYTRKAQAGDFCLFNRHLVELIQQKLSSGNHATTSFQDVWQIIRRDGGSVKNVPFLTAAEKKVYRTVWEINPLSLVKMAAERGPYIDQSQSFNCFLAKPDFPKLTAYLFATWRAGLKTGMYYCRSKPVAEAKDVVGGGGVAVASVNPTCQIQRDPVTGASIPCESCSS